MPVGYPYHFGGLVSSLSSEIIDRIDGDQNLQDQIDDIESNIDDIEADIDDINNGSLDSRYVEVGGDTMTGALSMSDNYIHRVKDPVLPKDAVNLSTLNSALDNVPGGDLDAPPYLSLIHI